MPSSPTSSPGIIPSDGKPWVVALIGAICIFVLFSYYTILKQQCCQFRDIRNGVLNEANPADPSLQLHSRRLESSITHTLPITQFKKKNEEEMTESNMECAVCLGEFEEGEWLKHLPNCTHGFHVACIDTWFQTPSNCPLCRSHVSDVIDHEYSVSMNALQETLRREDFLRDWAANYQIHAFYFMHN